MVNGIDGFMKQLLSTFKVEAGEHVQALAEGLVELEKSEGSPNQQEIVERVFRESHSLKGAARSVSIPEIEKVCQSMESIFAAVKHHEMTLSASLFDDLHQAVDYLVRLLPSIERKRTAEEKAAATGVVHLLENSLKKTQMLPDTDTALAPTLAAVTEPPLSRPEGDTPIALAAPEAIPLPAPNTEKKQPAYSVTPGSSETVRITTTKLERILMQTEGFLAVKLAAAAQTTSLREYLGDFDQWQFEWIKIHLDRIRAKKQLDDRSIESDAAADTLERLLLFLDWNHDFIANMTEKMVNLVKATEEDERSLVRMTDELQLEMKQMLVSSFSSLLVVLPKMVRDLAAEQGKEIDLVIQGADIEIDRRILEELKDPLIHLLRNCVDHGIEKPQVRISTGKPSRGRITISISREQGATVEVLVSDDGSGVDIPRVLAAAVKGSFITQKQAGEWSEADILQLLFHSGLSTSRMVTDISGRGLGLAIAREKIEKLRGNITIETTSGKGTIFRIILPLTLTNQRGVVVRSGDRLFIIPSMNVERAIMVQRNAIKTAENRETIQVGDNLLSLSRLGQILGLNDEDGWAKAESLPVVVLHVMGKRLAVQVDELLGEQEILMKNLGRQLHRVNNISGASFLSNGKMALILNAGDLFKSAVKLNPIKYGQSPGSKAAAKSILVVEDSITSRTLLKGILENAGFQVETAVDGIDAMVLLKTKAFDAVVSDVDMPRLNGFDLTARIRANQKWAELPVILVTALESQEHRERGVEVGASAYLVKSSFDQSNLVETVNRLI